MNVPKLRFKEFNDEWKKSSLGDFFSISAGGDIDKSHVSNIRTEKYQYPIYANALTNNGLYGYSDIFKIDGNSITVTGRGDIGKGLARNGKYYPIVRLLVLKSNNEFNNIFFANAINNINLYQESTGVPQLTSPQLGNYKVFYPSISEQNKIGNTLELIDKKIELQSKKIENLKLFKKGLVSNIFASFENTTKYKLGELLKEANIKTKTNNEHFIISSTTKGIFLQSEYFNKQAASDNNIGYKILKKNQLVLSPQNLWMGNININDKYNFGIVSPSYKIYDINNINLDLFKEWIKTARALYEYNMSSEQGASIVRKNLNEDLFKDITIYLPNLQFQNKYGNLFNKLNAKINLENNKLNNLQKLKKGLMQNMFV